MSFVEELQARGVVVSGFIATGYERKEVYPVHAVLNHLGESLVDFGGDIISVVSLRYQTFAKDLCCVRCGLRGLYFAKERGARFRKKRELWESLGGKYHFNLYGLTAEGKEVMPDQGPYSPGQQGRKRRH